MASPQSIDALRRHLETLVQRGERRRLANELARAARAAAAWWPAAIVAGPLGLALWRVGTWLANGEFRAVEWPLLAASIVAGPVLLVVAAMLRAWARHRRDRTAALALFERDQLPGDRLRCADEFIHSPLFEGRGLESAFMRAAVAQHEAEIIAALERSPAESTAVAAHAPRVRWLGVPAAAALALICLFWQISGETAPDRRMAAVMTTTNPGVAANESKPRRDAPRVAATPATPEPPAASGVPQRSAAREESSQEDEPSLEQSSGSGSQSSASSAAASAASKATPQRAAQPNVETPPPDAAELAKPEAPRKPAKARTTETAQLSAQADSGHGRSPSSSSSPPSPFDQPELPDRAGALADRDVEEEEQEDEDEQQKAEQSGQPLRSEQMADVGRDLLPLTPPPGPETDDPPTARGGPGDIKKSRGVPSMVLGIPIPDRIPGVPGAGRTKVTQEFAQPTPESHAPIAAELHATRNGHVGVVQQPELTAWRRQLLQKYFQYPRANAEPTATEELAAAQ